MAIKGGPTISAGDHGHMYNATPYTNWRTSIKDWTPLIGADNRELLDQVGDKVYGIVLDTGGDLKTTSPACQLTPTVHDIGVDAMRHSDLGHRFAGRVALGRDLCLQLRTLPATLATVLRSHRVQLFVNWTGSLSLGGLSSRWVRRTRTLQLHPDGLRRPGCNLVSIEARVLLATYSRLAPSPGGGV